MNALLEARDLAAGYGGPPVLQGVTFEAGAGERIGVLGPNGGGKSTLFRVLLGELRPLRGAFRRPRRLGFVPQTERSRLDYPVSALDVVGAVIPSQTTQAQPSAGATARLIALIRRRHVRAVFPESSLNPRLAETIARETGASSRFTLYGDTLGPSGSLGATYLGMERANADAMVRGLSGGRVRCA